MRRCLLILVLGLVTAAPVEGATGYRPPGVSPPPRTEEAKLAAFINVARSYWPGSPCAGREVVHLRAGAALARVRPDAPAAQGVAPVGECGVLLRGGMEPEMFCLVLAHELGHLAGREHSADRGDIMSIGSPSTGACVSATTSIARGRIWYDLIGALPDRGRGWHVTRLRSGALVASRSGNRRRWFTFHVDALGTEATYPSLSRR